VAGVTGGCVARYRQGFSCGRVSRLGFRCSFLSAHICRVLFVRFVGRAVVVFVRTAAVGRFYGKVFLGDVRGLAGFSRLFCCCLRPGTGQYRTPRRSRPARRRFVNWPLIHTAPDKKGLERALLPDREISRRHRPGASVLTQKNIIRGWTSNALIIWQAGPIRMGSLPCVPLLSLSIQAIYSRPSQYCLWS